MIRLPGMASGSSDGKLRLGDVVPDFEAETTKGHMHFHHWIKGRWVMLFSHPAAFTPVCTTEVGEVAMMHNKFKSKGFKVVGLSCDSFQDSIRWEKDILSHFSGHIQRIDFPIISDLSRQVAVKYGMIDPNLKDKFGLPLTSRTVFFIGPDKQLKSSMNYPATVGRDIYELLRVCDALLLMERESVATPASWPENHSNLVVDGKNMEGAVFLLPTISEKTAEKFFPDRAELKMPSGLKYMRLAHVKPAPPNCWAAFARFASRILSTCGWNLQDAQNWYAEQLPPTYSTPSMARLISFRQHPGVQRPQPSSGTKADLDLYLQSTDTTLRLGDYVPDFQANTTMGRLSFHQWIEGKWAILFCHPAAFTPVCTTEVGTLAMFYNTFSSKGFRVATLSRDTVEDLVAWQRDIIAHFDNKIRINFPLIADSSREVAVKYGMVDPRLRENFDVPSNRDVFIIGPDKRLKLSMNYPLTLGRSVHELLRICDALQLSARESVATPASWPNNHTDLVVNSKVMKGSVFLLSTITDEDAENFFPDCVALQMPSGGNYMRLTNINREGRMPT